MQKLQEINDKIISALEENNPFSLVRVGNMEGYFIDCFFKGTRPQQEFYSWLALTSGVYPITQEYLDGIWIQENMKAIENSDLLGFVDIAGCVERNSILLDEHCAGKYTFFGVENIEVLDPGIILNENLIKNPWTQKLKGKRVLVVSSHVSSITSQWESREKIWGDNLKNICDFDLVGVVRSPFHPQMDSRQYEGCHSWDQTLNRMKSLIDEYDYDVLLVGSAAYSPCLANHAKERGKIGITICGAIQIFFGVLGNRWTREAKSEGDRIWQGRRAKIYNEHWKVTLKEDLPENVHIFNQFEGAYW